MIPPEVAAAPGAVPWHGVHTVVEVFTGANQPWQPRRCQNSATGTRTRVARVRAEYPNQLDYSGSAQKELLRASKCCCFLLCNSFGAVYGMASAPVAQWIRHRPTEPGIAGSSPAGVLLPADLALPWPWLPCFPASRWRESAGVCPWLSQPRPFSQCRIDSWWQVRA